MYNDFIECALKGHWWYDEQMCKQWSSCDPLLYTDDYDSRVGYLTSDKQQLVSN